MKRRRLPDFLQGTMPLLDPPLIMPNWITIHQYIQRMRVDEESLCVLRSMMVSEYWREGGARMDIIVRLYGKFNSMRVELERTQL